MKPAVIKLLVTRIVDLARVEKLMLSAIFLRYNWKGECADTHFGAIKM